MFVCLFVRNFHKISRTTQSTITKLGHKQALVHDSCKFVGQECRSNNKVTRSQNRSNFESVITPSIFELEHRSKAQNIGELTGYLDVLLNVRYTLHSKSSLGPQMAAILKISKCFIWVHFDIRYEEIVTDYLGKDLSDIDEVSDDATVRL